MNYRETLLLAPEDLGPSGTKTIPIDVEKPISEILIRFKTTKASLGMSLPSPANIAKIELVDGSKRLFSLTGYECQALAYYSRPGIILDHGQHISTLSEVDLYPIHFGRHLWDKELAFLARKFVNPQLKITFDEDLSDNSVVVNELEVWASIFDDKVVNPMGFLSAIEHFDYTAGGNNTYETIALPEDRVYRQMLVRAYQDGYEPWYNIKEARFDEGSLDRIPWEYTDLEYYARHMKRRWNMITLQAALNSDPGGRISYLPMTDYWSGFVGMGLGAAEGLYHTNVSSRGGKLSIASSVGGNVLGLAFGYLPWHCYQFPFGMPDDISDWYNPAGKKPRLRLRAGTGGTSVQAQVVIEELYRY